MTGMTSDNIPGSSLRCIRCRNEVTEADEFCPRCGTLFHDTVFCSNHLDRVAEGACVICASAFCRECLKWKHGMFLCEVHKRYEIHQGMARVFGSNDGAQAQYAVSCLEQAEIHPFLYNRLPNMSTEVNAFLDEEHKVLVPVHEVMVAEEILRQLGILADRGMA